MAGLTLLLFLPALRFPFLNWDDKPNLILNPHFRGFALENLRWMFTTHYRGPYQPLSWLSFACDHAAWGMNPAGYHLTNILLHAFNAALALLIARRFFDRPLAIFCALFFALHPLRVESVAWVTERRDVLSGFFFLLAFYGYVRSGRTGPWIMTGFLLALLSKATAVGLLWALIAFDLTALKRPLRVSLVGKWPLALMGLLLACVNLRGFATGDLAVGHYGILERILIASHGAAFYAAKTVWPAHLSPYYLLPVDLLTIAPALALHAAAAAAATLILFRLRRRWPAALVAWICYLLILAPVSGLAQNGQQLAADRYSYLSCLPLAALAAGLLGEVTRRIGKTAGLSAATLIVLALCGLTLRQVAIWRDDVALWSRAVALSADNFLAQSNLATELFTRGDDAGALVHYEAALRLSPRDAQGHLNVGVIYERRGQSALARAHYNSVLAIEPGNLAARNNLAVLLLKDGLWDQAAVELERLLRQSPDFAQARQNLDRLRRLRVKK